MMHKEKPSILYTFTVFSPTMAGRYPISDFGYPCPFAKPVSQFSVFIHRLYGYEIFKKVLYSE